MLYFKQLTLGLLITYSIAVVILHQNETDDLSSLRSSLTQQNEYYQECYYYDSHRMFDHEYDESSDMYIMSDGVVYRGNTQPKDPCSLEYWRRLPSLTESRRRRTSTTNVYGDKGQVHVSSIKYLQKHTEMWCKNPESFEKGDSPIRVWRLDGITNLTNVFHSSCNNNKNVQQITTLDWHIPDALSFNRMFHNIEYLNASLNFDTEKVIDMTETFKNATRFNQPLNWDTRNVKSMLGMFLRASSFNQKLNFNTSQVTSMERMFHGANSFNRQLNFDTKQVTNMREMLNSAFSFNQPLNHWDTRSVTNMRRMFARAYNFNQPLNRWNTRNVNDMNGMFQDAIRFNQLLNWTVAITKWQNVVSIFSNTTNLQHRITLRFPMANEASKWSVSLSGGRERVLFLDR